MTITTTTATTDNVAIFEAFVDAFNALPERNRFVRGMICWTGFRATGVPFERAPRFAGKTKYNYTKLVKLAIDSLTGFTTAPLKIATWLGTLLPSDRPFMRQSAVGAPWNWNYGSRK